MMRGIASLLCVLSLVSLQACAVPSRDRGWLERAALMRTRHALGPRQLRDAGPLPPGCVFQDGLTPDEAVAIALWRSPALQAELTQLDSALADFDEARRLANPRLSLLAPIDPRQLALILAWPIDALWQLPARTELADRELQRVAEALVQSVLDAERDVRLAHADARAAEQRIGVLDELAESWRQAAEVAEAKLRVGDSSEAEAAPVRAEATLAKDAAVRGKLDLQTAQVRLLALLARPFVTLPPLQAAARRSQLPARATLVEQALQQRPDLRAAELALHAGAQRARWERSRVFSLVATLDGQTQRGDAYPSFSAGAQLDLPVFAQNQGGIGRADVAVQRAAYRYAATRLAVRAEVSTACDAVARARGSLDAYAAVLDSLDAAVAAATRAFENGAEGYLVVIDALRRKTDASLRRVALDAELDRAEAELMRAIGGRAETDTL